MSDSARPALRLISTDFDGTIHEDFAHAPFAPGFEDMRRRVPDTRKLQRLTGWKQGLDLGAMISDCLR